MKHIPLTQGLVAIVDDEDCQRLSHFKWRAAWNGGAFYAATTGYRLSPEKESRRLIFMHRMLLYAPRGTEVDHIDGNTLDNCRANLRLATHAQNGQNCKMPRTNSSGFKGVRKFRGCWQAYIKTRKKQYHLGFFDTPELAAQEYNRAAKLLFRQFARLNLLAGR